MARTYLILEASFLLGTSKIGVLAAWLLMKAGIPSEWLIRVKVKK